jgi:hypothetical protein
VTELNELFKVIAEGKKQYEETDPVGKKLKEVKENAKIDLGALFSQLTELKEGLEKELVIVESKQEDMIVEDMLNEEIPAQPIIHTPEVRAAQVNADVNKYLTGKSFQQPKPEVVNPDVESIRMKIKFLEQAIGKIAAAGPGSGEVNFRWLDDVNRSSIDKDRYLMYDPTTKKFLFIDTRVSIEAFDRTASIPLLATPQLLKPSSFTNSKNLTYDAATGVFTFLTQCEVTLALSVNALASASGQRVYQYAERNTGSGWTPIQNSGKSFQLTNTQHTQIVNAQTISRLAGEQIRYFIYTDEVNKVALITETLPNITDGTVYIPAIRIQYAGR